jgi:hypothetical protein
MNLYSASCPKVAVKCVATLLGIKYVWDSILVFGVVDHDIFSVVFHSLSKMPK